MEILQLKEISRLSSQEEMLFASLPLIKLQNLIKLDVSWEGRREGGRGGEHSQTEIY